MKPRALPKQYGKEWESWPTFDELRAKRPEMKLHKLRALLRDVTCYRCPDQTARYVQDELDELIDEEEAVQEAMAPNIDEDGKQVPKLYDTMVLFRESMRAQGELMKSMAELRRMIGDISEAAVSPMKLGLDLVRENVDLLRKRVEHYEGYHDETMLLRETMLSQQLDRELRIDKAKGQGKLREQAFSLAMGYLPSLINDLKTSASSSPRAQAALTAVETLEPAILDAIVEQAELTAEQRTAWRRVRDILQKPPGSNDNHKSNGHVPS